MVQRTGYQNSSRSHFQGFDIWGTANPTDATGPGWLGRYLDTLPSPVDPLVGWNTSRETPRALMARTVGVPAITNPATYSFASPNAGAEAGFERAAAVADLVAPAGRPPAPGVRQLHGAGGARHARPRGHGGAPTGRRSPIPNNGFAQALQAVAGAMYRQIGTKVFWVATGGYDTHANQNPINGAYRTLMTTVDDGLTAFDTDLQQPGPARLHAGAGVLGVRTAHHRERQPGHRPRRRRR